jgi:hypothetical protein
VVRSWSVASPHSHGVDDRAAADAVLEESADVEGLLNRIGANSRGASASQRQCGRPPARRRCSAQPSNSGEFEEPAPARRLPPIVRRTAKGPGPDGRDSQIRRSSFWRLPRVAAKCRATTAGVRHACSRRIAGGAHPQGHDSPARAPASGSSGRSPDTTVARSSPGTNGQATGYAASDSTCSTTRASSCALTSPASLTPRRPAPRLSQLRVLSDAAAQKMTRADNVGDVCHAADWRVTGLCNE